ncbi:MAG: hydantoinase/oxoprolinase family protein [Gammaproteobacteria bacterium]|nr:hydantoinase/oxoprolinase family protein [Gammaproteobacteria bacterium]
MQLVGVDTGGTFTDFVYFRDKRLRVHKVLSTPHAPEQAILQGLAELNVDLKKLKVIHGSTVATNAVLEGKGARTVYIGNRGLKDILLIGRQARRELYNLTPDNVAGLIDPELCLETGGRLSAEGEVLEPLTTADIDALLQDIQRLKPQAVAINLLYSYISDEFEKQIAAALPKDLFVSRSSAVLPEYKEYERGMTTWLNAYVGPLVKDYLQRLHQQIQPADLAVMLSAGGTASAEQAGNMAVNMLLSGPAGGLQAARYIGQQINCSKLLTFDMGGTSTDVALIDGEIRLTNDGSINQLPVAVAMVDMHTIGAGGGSIASVDEGGLLLVGPESAGADPGPVCYGKGGTQVTVTDANLVLGRIPANAALGGSLALDREAALTAMQILADKLGTDALQAAEGVIKIANEHMVQALRVMSVQKGTDPRDFSLVSFGGAGGLHVCDLAEAMDMKNALIPKFGGVLSAFGMLVAPVSRELSLTHLSLLAEKTDAELEALFASLKQKGEQQMQEEKLTSEDLLYGYSLDLRYLGQSFTLNVPWSKLSEVRQLFHETHKARYGHTINENIELVNLRMSIKGQTPSLSTEKMPKKNAARPINTVKVHACESPVPVYRREELADQLTLAGPAIIVEDVATSYVKPNWLCHVHESGHLQLQFNENL